MKKILLIGNGAREHVIGETLMRSPQNCKLAVFGNAGNPALKKLSSEYCISDLSDFNALKELVKHFKPDFVIIGPENPLSDGIVDFLAEIDIPAVGPTKELAQLESSKSFTRNLLNRYNIPGNPIFRVFHSVDGIRDFMEELNGDYVVKANSLQVGKGVKVSGEHLSDIDEGIAYAKQCIKSDGKVLIEEKLIGEEFSLICFSDGNNLIPCPLVQDHKRAYDGDTGPNTGGMGSYTDVDHRLPFITEEDYDDAMSINKKVIQTIKEETSKGFIGFLYGGFIAVKNGVRLIEYNARLGDPEAMNILSLLKSDFIEICEAMIQGKLNEIQVEFENKASVLKYIVPKGYPNNSVKNIAVKVPKLPSGSKVYLASIDERNNELYMLGSRALAVLGYGNTLNEAEALAEKAAKLIQGPVFHRKDIGTEELIQKRIDNMISLRN